MKKKDMEKDQKTEVLPEEAKHKTEESETSKYLQVFPKDVGKIHFLFLLTRFSTYQ